MATFWLFIKWLPQLYELALKLEKLAEEEILQFKIKKTNEKIDLIFLSNKSARERAGELDDVFKN